MFGKFEVFPFVIFYTGAKPEIRKNFTNAVLMPRAHLREGLALRETRAVTASIDSSDGLAWSLHELGRASNVGFTLKNLPVSDKVKLFAKINELDFLELVLYGGEEYELVLTIDPDLWSKAEKRVKNVGGQLIPIGSVTSEKSVIFKSAEERVNIEARGWEHFRSN